MSLETLWYGKSAYAYLLLPLSGLYYCIQQLHAWLYRSGIKTRWRAPVPVIVIGNLTAGGTGKTPLVIEVADRLQRMGRQPGIISRGYGGSGNQAPTLVRADSNPALAGDEPVMLSIATGLPVVVHASRQRAITRLLETERAIDVIVSDDGLQHYALLPDAEIAVVDAAREHGNGLLLPAGPLRETTRRLKQVDLVVYNGEHPCGRYYTSRISRMVNLATGEARTPADFANLTVAAVAGIGNPQRFFTVLREAGMTVIEYPFRDHHAFTVGDVTALDAQCVVMTRKDAVKVKQLDMDLRHCWSAEQELVTDAALDAALDQLLQQIFKNTLNQQQVVP